MKCIDGPRSQAAGTRAEECASQVEHPSRIFILLNLHSVNKKPVRSVLHLMAVVWAFLAKMILEKQPSSKILRRSLSSLLSKVKVKSLIFVHAKFMSAENCEAVSERYKMCEVPCFYRYLARTERANRVLRVLVHVVRAVIRIRGSSVSWRVQPQRNKEI